MSNNEAKLVQEIDLNPETKVSSKKLMQSSNNDIPITLRKGTINCIEHSLYPIL